MESMNNAQFHVDNQLVAGCEFIKPSTRISQAVKPQLPPFTTGRKMTYDWNAYV